MEHKSWLWKKKSIEKTMFTPDKVNRGNEDELQGILAYEDELERNLNISNEKLSNALAEIKTKDDIAKKQTNIAREAIQGWEKAEAEVLALKQELEKATQQTAESDERLYGVDAALKECMHQLRFVREEQEKRIHDAVMKTSREYEKSRIILEEKLSESNKKLSKLISENTHLTKALLSKEKLIDELHLSKNQLDSDLSSLMSRLESTQRDNASLSYEVRVMEKELEIRNEERDFNRRTADVAHKQHLASVKKIAQLETEAQRLRVLVRKRLPGPAALAKMKTEVELLGKKSNFDHDSITSSKQINFLTEQLCSLEEENKLLKEFITQKTNLSASSDIDEKASMAESWAPSCKTVGASDIGLMDDFIEMEKLAIVSVENQETPFDKKSIEKLIEMIEGMRLCDKASETSTTTEGYTVRVLQWKTCELSGVVESFVKTCNGLLNRSVDFEKFVKELTLTLEWIVNHCFSLQDVSSMRHEMDKRFDWGDENRGEFEEVKKLKDDLDNLEQKLELEVGKSELLVMKVKESEKVIENLELELESLKVSKELDMKVKEDLDEQLIEAIGEYNEIFEKSMSVEGQESNNTSCNQELESENLDQQFMSECVIERDIQTIELNEDEKRLQSEREIIVASEKLAECQETILNLGKQLKALASPINTSVGSDKIICNPIYEAPPPPPPPPPVTAATNHHRISLLDKMMAEDAAKAIESTKTKSSFVGVNGINGINHQEDEDALVNFLSIVPSKKKKSGVLRKLLWRRKKSNK